MTTHSAAPATAGPAASTVALASAAMLAMMTVINVVVGIPEPPAVAIAGLPVAAVPVYFEARARRKTTREQSLQAIASMEGVELRQTLSVVIVVSALLLVLESLVGAAVGSLVSMGRVTSGLPPTGADFATAYTTGMVLIGVPVLGALSVAIGVQAGRYLQHRIAPWLALAAALMVPARLAIIWGSASTIRRSGLWVDYVEALTGMVILAVFLFVGLWLGSLWGRRNREVVLLSRSFKRLNADDRRAALDMLRAAAQQELTRATRPDGPEADQTPPST